MKKRTVRKIPYTDEPMELVVVRDFLPRPENLILREETVKITIGLSKTSVAFFKAHAKRRHAAYQAMIRRVIDLYVQSYRGRRKTA